MRLVNGTPRVKAPALDLAFKISELPSTTTTITAPTLFNIHLKKMGSASSKAWAIGRYLSTHEDLRSILNSSLDPTSSQQKPKTKISNLAGGAYHNAKLVELLSTESTESTEPGPRFLLYLPKEDTSLPNQFLNEIGCLLYVKLHTNIPVPSVYAWSTEPGQEYIALEYVEGELLSSAWSKYTEDEKEIMVKKLAKITAEMVDIRFDKIGGVTPDGKLGPAVEKSKILKGRSKFHATENCNIGPYDTIQEYANSYLDGKVRYLSTLPSETNSGKAPLPTLLSEFKALEISLSKPDFRADEPFVLRHGDFHGRNIVVQGTDIVGVVGWGFAGSYPLSEVLNRDPITVIENSDAETSQHNLVWGRKILEEVERLIEANEADQAVSNVGTEEVLA